MEKIKYFFKLLFTGRASIKMSKESKAFLEILIREIRDTIEENEGNPSKAVEEINKLLDSWVRANDLHPERVEKVKLWTSTKSGEGLI